MKREFLSVDTWTFRIKDMIRRKPILIEERRLQGDEFDVCNAMDTTVIVEPILF